MTQITSTVLQLSSQPYPNFHGERIFNLLKTNSSRFVCRVDEKEQNPGLVLGTCQVTKCTKERVGSMMQLGTSSRGKSVSGKQNTSRQKVKGQGSLVTMSSTLPCNMHVVKGRRRKIVLEKNGICLY